MKNHWDGRRKTVKKPLVRQGWDDYNRAEIFQKEGNPMTKNLTTGSPMGLIASFALPTLFGMLFQQLYNLVDTMIVGKLLGSAALAAVGAAFIPTTEWTTARVRGSRKARATCWVADFCT